jgi:hypothetical protein
VLTRGWTHSSGPLQSPFNPALFAWHPWTAMCRTLHENPPCTVVPALPARRLPSSSSLARAPHQERWVQPTHTTCREAGCTPTRRVVTTTLHGARCSM